MSQRRLKKHLEHILRDVVPQRGAAQAGMSSEYITGIEARLQPPHLVRGLEQWNAGAFYEQHETLEWLWRATPDAVRDALKGIIQSGVGAYHVQRRNRRGALGKWTGAIGYLKPFEGLMPYGIDVGDLRQQVVHARQALLEDEGKTPDWPAHLARIEAMSIRWQRQEAEPQVTALLRQIDEAWQDSDLSVEHSIHALGEEEASFTPNEKERSIQSLLIDLATTKIMSTTRCFDNKPSQTQEVLSPLRWRKFLHWVTDSHESFRKPVGFLKDEQLHDTRFMFEETLSIKLIIEANIKHDFYHAHEIRLLRKIYQDLQKQNTNET